MKLKNLVQTMTLSILASAMLIGCGGGGSSADTQTGTFVDAPVKGLYFKTATQQGYTNESGEFTYKAGETVEFKLGNLSLGTVSAGDLITPYTLAGDTNISNPSDKATNIAMLLQSFDGNRSNTGMLDVSKLKDVNLSDINISVSVSDMTTKIANKFADNGFSQYRDITNNTPVNATTAKNTMKTYVEAKLASLTISVETGFGTEWLKGRTVYYVQKENSAWVIDDVTFINGKQSYHGGVFAPDYIVNSYGIIRAEQNDDGTYQMYKIYSIDGSKIRMCNQSESDPLANFTCTDNMATQYYFTSQADAQAFVQNN